MWKPRVSAPGFQDLRQAPLLRQLGVGRLVGAEGQSHQGLPRGDGLVEATEAAVGPWEKWDGQMYIMYS